MSSLMIFKKPKVSKFTCAKKIKKTAMNFRDYRKNNDNKFNEAVEKCSEFIQNNSEVIPQYKHWAVFDIESNLIEITDNLKSFCENISIKSLSLLYATNCLKNDSSSELRKLHYKGYYVREVSHIVSGICFPLLSELEILDGNYVSKIIKTKEKHDFWVIKEIHNDALFQARDVLDIKSHYNLDNHKPLYATSTILSLNERKRPHFKKIQLTRSVDLINELVAI